MHILLKSLLKDLLNEIKSQQDSPQFKKWFKHSKVVDGSGKPLRVYHGTSKDADFSKFKSKQNGIWFTSSPDSASSYANQNDSMKNVPDWSSGRMSYKSVNIASRVIPVYLSIQNAAKLSDEQAYKLKHASNYTKAQNEVFGSLRSQGYDGVDIGDGIYVVFDPTQIKSAIGNNGEFNPNDPNIHK